MIKLSRIIAAIMLMMAAMTCCTKPDESMDDSGDDGYVATVVPHNGGNNDSITHGFVDLGLPSGLLWATCNIGASCPEDCGDFFAWGETATKEMYDWKQYKFAAYDDDQYCLTKYCSNSSYGLNGFVDSLTVLEPLDDAVRATWGRGWRMPTADDWRELLQYTTDTITIQNGVSGRLFASPNGNSLFLPNTGFFLDNTILCPNLGIYWSSTLQTTFQIVAWSYHSDLDECHVCGTYERSRGHCVRAVRSAE